jgi:hypothetical protein
MASHFTGDVEFVESMQHNRFDLIRVRVSSGEHGFPADYGGASGGALWFAPFGMDPEVGIASIQHIPPQLLGVVFWQFNAMNGKRVLVAHGPRSIFGATLRRLQEQFDGHKGKQ